MSQALRKLTGNLKNANCLCIFINQIRMKIGVMFGNPKCGFEGVSFSI
jgi:recombination protein RecA